MDAAIAALKEIKMDEFMLINELINYCKTLIGNPEWKNRFQQCQKFFVDIKTKPIILQPKNHESGVTFVSPLVVCKDIPMWYLFNAYNYVNNPHICDLGLIARLIPKLIRIAQFLPILSEVNGFSKKMNDVLNKNNPNIENSLFEILVACTYLRNGANEVEFLFDRTRKMADIKSNLNGELFIECKRKTKESDYSKKEREAWYKQYLPVQDYLNTQHISLVLKVTFHSEIESYPPDYLYSIIIKEITKGNIFYITNDQITIETYEPDFISINSQKDSMWKIYSPRLSKILFKRDDDLYGVTSSMKSDKHNVLTDYIENITEACAGLWYCDSQDALTKKSVSFKRHICEAIEQIPDDQIGAIHIGYESYDGDIVEELNFERTLEDIDNLVIGKKKIDFIYIHNLRLMLPEDKNWDVEETVLPLSNRTANKNQLLKSPHVITY